MLHERSLRGHDQMDAVYTSGDLADRLIFKLCVGNTS